MKYIIIVTIFTLGALGCRKPDSPTSNAETTDEQQALADGRTALEAARNHYNVGSAFIVERKFDRAIDPLKKAVSLDPNFTDAMDHLGIAFRNLGDLSSAEKWYRRSLEVKPDNVTALLNIALVLSVTQRTDEAIDSIQHAIEVEPNNPETYYGLGQLLHSHQDYSDSIPYAEKALVLYTESKSQYVFDASYILGEDLFRIGDWTNAVLFLQSAKRKYNQNQQLDDILLTAQERSKNRLPQKDAIIELVRLIRQNPISEISRGYYSDVIEFTKESDDVHVEISAKAIPWLSSIADVKWRSYLLGSFIAGNVESQLIQELAIDDPDSGNELVALTYKRIKQFERGFTVMELENP